MDSKREKINIVTLGCSKNLVDSEQLMKQLTHNNFKVIHNSNSFDYKVVIINTCGFIQEAKEESINTILQFIYAKEKGEIDKIFVIGCLSERYKKELIDEMPEIDGFFGVNELDKILLKLKAEINYNSLNDRILTNPGHYAYLKIAEGCDRKCSFCAIPKIRGKFKSKEIDALLDETMKLTEKGVKELILISQDLTYYGLDIYKRRELPVLIKELLKIKEIEWIRLQYTYPNNFPMEIIKMMKVDNRICNYLDIPFQHISDKMLRLMRRGISKIEIYNLIKRIRKINSNIALRTTLLVGHPGETDKDFQELIKFIKEIKFERLGVFKYSHEDDTYAFKKYNDDIPLKIKQQRAERIMEVQQQISLELNDKKVGKVFRVIIDGEEGDNYVGRTEFDSPEVDGEVIIKEYPNNIKVGDFYKVRIVDNNEYDLFGKVLK